MLQPGVRTVTAILSQLHPFEAKGAEDTIGLDRLDERVRAESGGALLSVTTPRLVRVGVQAR